MDQTEEEQVETLKRWWQENGTSTVAAIVVALASGFGWQAWQGNQIEQAELASDTYQAMMRAINAPAGARDDGQAIDLAEQLKSNFGGTTYAEFAALHLAGLAVQAEQLPEAEAQLRWVLGKADKGSDTADVAQLRLARVLASAGDTEQALAIIGSATGSPYAAAYAIAQGDIYYSLGRHDEARVAYSQALALASTGQTSINLPSVEQKLQSLSAILPSLSAQDSVTEIDAVEVDTVDTVDAVEVDAVEVEVDTDDADTLVDPVTADSLSEEGEG